MIIKKTTAGRVEYRLFGILLHRKDGPAVIEKDGTKRWYLWGKNYEVSAWNERTEYYSDKEVIELKFRYE